MAPGEPTFCRSARRHRRHRRHCRPSGVRACSRTGGAAPCARPRRRPTRSPPGGARGPRPAPLGRDPERLDAGDGVEVRFGCDLAEHPRDRLASLVVVHSSSGLWNSRSISARKRAPRRPSLTRWSADRWPTGDGHARVRTEHACERDESLGHPGEGGADGDAPSLGHHQLVECWAASCRPAPVIVRITSASSRTMGRMVSSRSPGGAISRCPVEAGAGRAGQRTGLGPAAVATEAARVACRQHRVTGVEHPVPKGPVEVWSGRRLRASAVRLRSATPPAPRDRRSSATRWRHRWR